MIRQALGRGCRASMTFEEHKKKVSEILYEIQKLLLPQTPEEEVREFTHDLLVHAINLRDAMTEEQTIYRPYMPNPGDAYNTDLATIVAGEEPLGNVFFSVYPGLTTIRERPNWNQGDPGSPFVTIPIVKAEVKLEAAFVIIGIKPTPPTVPPRVPPKVNDGSDTAQLRQTSGGSRKVDKTSSADEIYDAAGAGEDDEHTYEELQKMEDIVQDPPRPQEPLRRMTGEVERPRWR